MMAYLIVNRAAGIVMLLLFIFFMCALVSINIEQIKVDFREWSRRRQLRKAMKPTRKGLHK
jgi:uncharacterized protein HemY